MLESQESVQEWPGERGITHINIAGIDEVSLAV